MSSDDLTITDDGSSILPQEKTISSSVARRDTKFLHRAYSFILDHLELTEAHAADLCRRGLAHDQVQRGQYRTLAVGGRARIGQELYRRFGSEVAGIPGVVQRHEGGASYWTISGAAGLLVPVRDADGHVVALKVRRDDAQAGPKYLYMSSKRDGGLGPGAPVHTPVFAAGLDTETIRVTEGELKSDVATCLTGIVTISIPGVSSWRAAIPVLRRLGIRRVRLAFDADVYRNPHVARALLAATRAFTTEGW